MRALVDRGGHRLDLNSESKRDQLSSELQLVKHEHSALDELPENEGQFPNVLVSDELLDIELCDWPSHFKFSSNQL